MISDAMFQNNLNSEIAKMRSAIRYHRAQLGDYRCWVDDIRAYQSADLAAYHLPQVPPPARCAQYCQAFWENRQRPHEKGKGDPALNSEHRVLPLPHYSDEDLDSMSPDQLQKERDRLRDGILQHESYGFLGRTVVHDEKLYQLLPEVVAWNSGLPPRETFLPHCAEFCGHCQSHPEHFLEWSEKK
jgi:hypothetical protein